MSGQQSYRQNQFRLKIIRTFSSFIHATILQPRHANMLSYRTRVVVSCSYTTLPYYHTNHYNRLMNSRLLRAWRRKQYLLSHADSTPTYFYLICKLATTSSCGQLEGGAHTDTILFYLCSIFPNSYFDGDGLIYLNFTIDGLSQYLLLKLFIYYFIDDLFYLEIVIGSSRLLLMPINELLQLPNYVCLRYIELLSVSFDCIRVDLLSLMSYYSLPYVLWRQCLSLLKCFHGYF